ncbi:hypothetical protein FRC08_012411, partial [Ceratobasidium sp. 394]
SLNGLAQVGDFSSSLSIDKGASYLGDNIVEESFNERVEVTGRRASKGIPSTGIKLPPSSGSPPAPTQSERPRATTDSRRTFGSRQGVTRTPTNKALLVTADSAPPLGRDDKNEPLDYTAKDSERFAECLKKLGFELKVVKAVGTEFLTEEAFTGGLDFLFSNAADGEVLVLLISMHATYIKNMGVYLKFVDAGGSVVLMGTRDLVDIINAKLRTVRCTVEVILDICHAAGLIKCKYVIRQMESKTMVVSPIAEADASPSVGASSLLLTGDHHHNKYPGVSVSHLNLDTRQTVTNTPRHINQAVVGSSSVSLPLSKLAIPSAATYNNPFLRAFLPIDLQTASDIFVWVAARESQNAFERTKLGSKNGALVDAVCTAIEENGYLPRKEVFDKYISVIIGEENAAAAEDAKLQSTEAQEEPRFELQEAQLLSNRNYKSAFLSQERILKANIFQAVPKV